MMRLKAQSDAVFLAEEDVVHFTKTEVHFLKEKLIQTGLKRNRICSHKSSEEPLQEMLIAFAKGSYIRPSKHLGKEESIHVLEGTANFVFFDTKGEITHVIPVGERASGMQEYVRTPVEVFHTVLITSEFLVVQETTQGPFTRADTVFADWAPEDGNTEEIDRYILQLETKVLAFR